MKSPPRSAGREKSEINGGATILGLPRSPCNTVTCDECHDHSRPVHASLRICSVCLGYRALRSAVAAFREGVSQ